jgi:hypothetical protein
MLSSTLCHSALSCLPELVTVKALLLLLSSLQFMQKPLHARLN